MWRGMLVGLAFALAAAPASAHDSQWQGGPERSGHVRGAGLTLPLERAWSRRVGLTMSTPAIADGNVFVAHDGRAGRGLYVDAYAARTGRRVWRRQLGSSVHRGHVIAGKGRVHVAVEHQDDRGRSIVTLDTRTGRELWAATLEGLFFFDITLVGDTLYAAGSRLYALDAATGAVRWAAAQRPLDEHYYVVAADAQGPYVVTFEGPHPGRRLTAYSASDGAARWSVTSASEDPAFDDDHVALAGGRLYFGGLGTILDASSGASAGTFPRGQTVPVIAGGTVVTSEESGLPGRSVVASRGGAVRWRFGGDRYLQGTPLAVDGLLFTGSGAGRLYALSLVTGRVRWRGRAPRPVLDHRNTGMAAGGGVLAVPTATRLVAFR